MCNVINPQGTFTQYPTVAVSSLVDGYQAWVDNTGGVYRLWLYDPRQDAALALPDSGQAVQSGGDGLALAFHPNGPTGTASAGGASTLTTTLTIPGSLAGYAVRITGGTGAGQEATIASNTYGANAVLTVSSPWSTAPDNTSTYLLLTGRWWAFNGQTTPSLRVFDMAQGSWSGRSTTGITAATGWRMVSTPGYGSTVASGTATLGTGTTLMVTGKTWTVNQWANYQVRITGGTGAGQVRTVTSNTATTLTVAAWTTNPDTTSTYVLEPNDDFLYATSTGGVALYRYSISGDSWSTLSPGAARTASPGNGLSLGFIGIASDASWATESTIKNGRYLYSFQGGGSQNLSYYDIVANTWVNLTTSYRNGGVSSADFFPGTNWFSTMEREFIYLGHSVTSSVGSLFYRFNCVTQTLEPFTVFPIPYPSSGNQPAGNRLIVSSYTDGGTVIRWLYFLPFQLTGTIPAPLYRMMII